MSHHPEGTMIDDAGECNIGCKLWITHPLIWVQHSNQQRPPHPLLFYGDSRHLINFWMPKNSLTLNVLELPKTLWDSLFIIMVLFTFKLYDNYHIFFDNFKKFTEMLLWHLFAVQISQSNTMFKSTPLDDIAPSVQMHAGRITLDSSSSLAGWLAVW